MNKLRLFLIVLALIALVSTFFLFLHEEKAADSIDGAGGRSAENPEIATSLQEDERLGIEDENLVERRDLVADAAKDTREKAPSRMDLYQVRVVDDEGIGQAHVRVIPWIGSHALDEHWTNASGAFAIAGWLGEGGFLVDIPGRYPTFHFVDGVASDVTIPLNIGKRISGQVIFKTPWPREFPFRLRIEGDHSFTDDRVPPNLQAEDCVFEQEVTVDEEGNFEFLGLPEDWFGVMGLPHEAVLCAYEGPGDWRVGGKFLWGFGPTENLRLTVNLLPYLTGRVVSPDGAYGIEGVYLSAVAYQRNADGDGRSIGTTTDEQGVFRIPLPMLEDEDTLAACAGSWEVLPGIVELEIEGTEAWSSRKITLDQSVAKDPWKLGDIPLGLRSKITLRVVDESGKPIEGALAEGEYMSEATNEDGFTEVALNEEDPSIRVAAFGYRTILVNDFSKASDSLEVTLAKANRLTIHFTLPDGCDRDRVSLLFRSEEPIFEQGGSSGGSRKLRRELGLSMSSGGGRKGKRFESYRISRTEDIMEFWEFTQGVAITCALTDSFGQPFVTSAPLFFGESDHHTLDLIPSLPPRRLVGRVVDQRGANVMGADILVWGSESTGRGARTDEEGAFDLGAIANEEVALKVTAQGLATFINNTMKIPLTGELLIELQDAREVLVYATDSSGEPVTGASLGRYELHGSNSAIAESDGVYRFQNLPQDACEVTWSYGSLHETFLLPALTETYELQLPVMGSLLVSLSTLPADQTRSYRLILDSIDGEVPPSYKPSRSFSLPRGQAKLEHRFDAHFPGRFQARLEVWTRGEERFHWQPVMELGQIEVLPNQTTEIVATF